MARLLADEPLLTPPPTTMMGALLHYITHAEPKNFQPMKANMGILPPLEKRVRRKLERYAAYAERAQVDMEAYLGAMAFQPLAYPDEA
jgi:methylenetetrahydrofolate--tRNA-(uracil-5-)-methyltransferase